MKKAKTAKLNPFGNLILGKTKPIALNIRSKPSVFRPHLRLSPIKLGFFSRSRYFDSMVDGLTSCSDGRSQSVKLVLSPEDIAWVDSCLIQEKPDILDSNWNHMKDSLMEILTLHPVSFESSSAASDNLKGGTIDIDMLPSDNEEPTSRSGTDDDPVSVTEARIAGDDSQNHNDIENFASLSFRGNPFLPTYNDGDEKETIQTRTSIDSSEFGSESPINDIFRVWDLKLPAVEDELFEQLNQVLSENSIPPAPSVGGNFIESHDSKGELPHDLIDGISGLSLKWNN